MNPTQSNSEINPPRENKLPVRQGGVLTIFGLFLTMWFKLVKFSLRTAMSATRGLVKYANRDKIDQSKIGKETVE